uniref:NADH dehydrogenase subunit 1 n=1 Tax=Cochlostyla marinduquensis TaxID=2079772 RepID=UPI00233EAC21|nr:NADH dehydrogenase subunit 1 [Cochlostyla marinduquensis]UIX22048.1 NADH dehydrogenase subunit 1 [Cochlostyla marinduquensis]
MLSNMLSMVCTFLCILISVAYMTMLERKLLSYLQLRKGPNKVGVCGILQPLSDALKLFMKSNIIPLKSSKFIFTIMPMIGFLLSMLLWGLLPSFYQLKANMLGIMLFICISSLNVYILFGSGWSSNSVYSFLGSMRASAQMISYEVSMLFLLSFPVFMLYYLDLDKLLMSYPVMFLMVYMFLMWLACVLAETNRAPYDFAEGESELVSGYNIEFSSGLFAFLFLGEYICILFMSVLTSVCYLMTNNMYSLLLMVLLMVVWFLLIRGVYPRYRYDKLMSFCWTSMLPLSMSYLSLVYIMWLL